MSKPLVSVAIPFFNNQETLAEAIASVLNQGYSNWELLLLDDGSTDQSLEVAKAFKDERICLISDGQNKGLVSRLNQSISWASGKYYARMDADDLMHPDRLETQMKFLDAHPEVDVVDTAMYILNQEGELTGIRSKLPPAGGNSLRSILFGESLNHATVVGRTEWFLAHLYDPQYVRSEDTELWCRTVGGSTFARIMQPLYFVREGMININNYRVSQLTARLIYRRYGPQTLNWRETQMLVMMSYMKSCIYTLMGWFGMQDVLTKSRNTTLDPLAREEAQQKLHLALKR